jgi:hypothetical protein
MGNRKYLVIVDTTYSPVPTQFPKAIIDVQIVSATDEQHARQIFLRGINQNLANQLQHNLYVLDLEMLTHDMDVVEQRGGTPVFKFVLPGNRRPPRSLSLEQRVIVQSGNQTLTQPNDSHTVDQRSQMAPPPVEPPTANEVITQANKSLRSSQFQQKEYEARTTTSVLTEEQRRLISKLGADQRTEGANEAVVSKVNASAGINATLTPQHVDTYISNNVSPEQAAILAKLGASLNTQIVHDPDLIAEIQETSQVPIDPSLTELPGEQPLTAEQIAALQAEI